MAAERSRQAAAPFRRGRERGWSPRSWPSSPLRARRRRRARSQVLPGAGASLRPAQRRHRPRCQPAGRQRGAPRWSWWGPGTSPCSSSFPPGLRAGGAVRSFPLRFGATDGRVTFPGSGAVIVFDPGGPVSFTLPAGLGGATICLGGGRAAGRPPAARRLRRPPSPCTWWSRTPRPDGIPVRRTASGYMAACTVRRLVSTLRTAWPRSRCWRGWPRASTRPFP